MKKTVALLAISACALVALPSRAGVEERDVKRFFESMDRALRAKDVAGFLLHYADGAAIVLSVKGPGGLAKKRLDKRGLSEMLTQNFSLFLDYRIKRRFDDIKIDREKQTAAVSATETETLVMDRMTVVNTSRSDYALGPGKQGLLITGLSSLLVESRMESRP